MTPDCMGRKRCGSLRAGMPEASVRGGPASEAAYFNLTGASDNFLMEEEYSDGVIPVIFLNWREK